MPYTSPATVVTGTTISSTTFGNAVKAATDYLANPPACRVYHSAAQSIAHNTLAALAFDSERFDTDTMHDTVTNNSRITIKTAGLYAFTCAVEFTLAADYTRLQVGFKLNGTTYLGFNEVGTTTISDTHFISNGMVYKFAVNDYVEAFVRHNNGASAARNVTAAANYSPEFSAVWVGLG